MMTMIPVMVAVAVVVVSEEGRVSHGLMAASSLQRWLY
jgi:hypothetical protein